MYKYNTYYLVRAKRSLLHFEFTNRGDKLSEHTARRFSFQLTYNIKKKNPFWCITTYSNRILIRVTGAQVQRRCLKNNKVSTCIYIYGQKRTSPTTMTSGHNNPYLYYFYVIIIHTRNRARGPRGRFVCVFNIIILFLSLSLSICVYRRSDYYVRHTKTSPSTFNGLPTLCVYVCVCVMLMNGDVNEPNGSANVFHGPKRIRFRPVGNAHTHHVPPPVVYYCRVLFSDRTCRELHDVPDMDESRNRKTAL